MINSIHVGINAFQNASVTPREVAQQNHVQTIAQAKQKGMSNSEIHQLESSGAIECETCKERKYQDGSDEMVSFKSAAHISPEAAGTTVRAHEQEHVSNAYDKAAKKDGKVIQASVSIKTAVCPECGRTYVSGGETTTKIKYNKDPYGQQSKGIDRTLVPGRHFDAVIGNEN